MINYLIIGINGYVAAINKDDGQELWRTKLKTSTITVVTSDERKVYASASGYLFCLDKATGQELWTNKLKGLGFGTCIIDTGSNQTGVTAIGATIAASVAASAGATTSSE
jgi:outer membrane protein assembly factor BamB